MSAAVADKKAAPAGAATAADLLALLGDGDMPVSDVLAVVPESVLAGAWARGDVEFGRVAYCVTGRPGVPESKPTLVLEINLEWSGKKTERHDRLAKVLSDLKRVPECAEYKRYTLQELVGRDESGVDRWKTLPPGEAAEDGRETRYTTTKCSRAEAVAALAARVRLTDKGLAALQS